ncbi:MAG TPA: ABC transporter substrate-binding protein [Candidatus Binatia bacterium]
MLVAACARPQERPPGYLVVGLDAAPTALDPRTASDASSTIVLDLVHRGLTTTNAAGEPTPDLAERWESPDPLTYRFHLRAARFHDGAPVRADDVVATYRSLASPALRAQQHEALELVAEVVAEDERTVRFTLREPAATFLHATRLAILPAKCAALPECRIGAGPFRLESADIDTVRVAASDTAEPRPALPGILFRVAPDSVSRALALARGAIDLVQNAVEPDLLPWLEEQGLDVVATPGSTFHYVGLDLRDPLLADLRVRRAIAHAIDRESIVRFVLAGHARPANGLFPPEHWAHHDGAEYRYDPALARRLVEEAGAAGRRLTLKTSSVEIRRRVGEVVAAMLGEVGLDVEVRPLEWASLYGDVRRGRFDLFILAWVGIEDPDHWHTILHSRMTPPHGSNRGGYANDEVDLLTLEARRLPDREQRLERYRRVTDIAQRDLPFVPLWWVDNVVVKTKRLDGFVPTPTGDLRSLATARLISVPPATS